MYAVIKTGGKQYRVKPDDVIDIEKIPGETGDVVEFTQVLMLGGENPLIGTPLVDGVVVAGTVVEQWRGRKVIIFKKRRRHNSRRKNGHRQELSSVKITEILTGGKRAAGAVAKPDAAAADAAGSKKSSKSAAGKSAAAAGSAALGLMDAGAAAGGKSARAAAGSSRAFSRLKGPEGIADDLTLIGGVGPKNAEALNKLGIYHFWQLAAMSPADITTLEDEIGFNGRVGREEWVEQSKELMAGKAPRAKVDRFRAAPGATGKDKFVRLTGPEGTADDLTLIGGVGPKINEILHMNGIYHFWQIAAMTADDVAEVEKDLSFPGRIGREEWVQQSQELMAGKAPRAKTDRDRA